jgi:predicted nucleotidyltransferase
MGPIPPEVAALIAKYILELKVLGVTPSQVILFGAQTQGTATPLSDIDLLVVSPDFERIPPGDHLRVLAQANWRLLAPIQAMPATPAELASAGPLSFLREILRQGVALPC